MRPNLTQAFSLVEVVIALGIVSFAIVAVMGMLPLAWKTGRESLSETDATHIARRIFSELQYGSGANRTVSINSTTGTLVDLSQTTTNTVIAFRETGEAAYLTNSTASVPDVDFLAQISVFTNTGLSNLSRVQVDVHSPAAAPPTNRLIKTFVTLLGY